MRVCGQRSGQLCHKVKKPNECFFPHIKKEKNLREVESGLRSLGLS